MSLLMVRKSAPAKAADAQDANGNEVIAQKNGYKLVYNTKNDGYWFYTKSGAGWGLTATNKVAAINEFNRLVNSAKDAADAVDAAAQFKVGDKIWVDPSYGANLNIGYGWNVGIVKRVGTGNIDVDFKGQVISVPAPYCARVNSSGKPVFDSAAKDAADAAAQDDFKNPRFISSLTQDVSRLKEKYDSALKESKDNFAYWFKRKVLDEATYLKEIIVEAIASKETSPEEVAKLKLLKDECNKSIQKVNAMLSKINSLN